MTRFRFACTLVAVSWVSLIGERLWFGSSLLLLHVVGFGAVVVCCRRMSVARGAHGSIRLIRPTRLVVAVPCWQIQAVLDTWDGFSCCTCRAVCPVPVRKCDACLCLSLSIMSIQIPVEAAVNKNEVQAYKERLNKRQKCHDADHKADNQGDKDKDAEEEEIKPVVPLSACLARLAAEETLSDYRSPATGKPGPALKHVRIQNFPRYLLVQLRR